MAHLLSRLTVVTAYLGFAATLFSASATWAQTSKPGNAWILLQGPQLGFLESGCPVLITADRRSSARRLEAGSMNPVRPAQGVTVTINGFRPLRITGAEVVVHALSPKNRALLTGPDATNADITKPFHLAAKESGALRGDLWMENVASIQWIEVKSLTYSTGKVWHESEDEKCSVRPNPYVLISSAN